jgi:hypothetical protein
VIRQPADPVRGDPFVAFSAFPTHKLGIDNPLAATPGASGEAVRGLTGGLDLAFTNMRASIDECAQALDLLASGQAKNVREVLLTFPANRRRLVQMGLAWMAKLGFIDWLD